jgi:transglutaminase-like putative cysteine protease
MRLNIRHETTYRYDAPASRAIEVLRLTPRGHDGQYIHNWRIDVDHDCRLDQTTDPFGNTMHTFTLEGPLQGLSIVAEGSVETTDTSGVLSGQVERFPPVVFLRETALTTTDEALRAFALDIESSSRPDRLTLLHAVMAGMRARMQFEIDATDTGTSAVEAFRLGHGVCQDFAHVFLAVARHLGIPARYVAGYLLRRDVEQSAGHAWAEALIPDLGWVGFDPTNGICPTEAYVRVAVGLDYLGAAPVRGSIYGGTGERLAVRVSIASDSSGGR